MALFLFALIPFSVMMFIFHGVSWEFFSALRLSLMATLLGYLFSTFQYNSHISRIENFSKLELDSNHKTENMVNLKKVYDELELSHKITEAMMKITTEILKNDRLDDVLQLVLDEAVKLVPKAQAGSILILSGERMEFRAAREYNLEKLQKITLYFKDLFQATLEDIYEPAIIKNLRTFDEGHLSPETFKNFKSNDSMVAQAVLTCSFKFDGRFFGSINLDNFDSEESFNDSDKYMIAHLAKQLEITIGIHKLYEKAIRPTKYDELTQAFTRKYHKELLAIAFQKAKDEDSPLSICTFDINLFKEINDTYGHETGDECLAHFSRTILGLMTPEMFFSRVGGDEFVLVLSGKRFQEATAFIKTIREMLKATPFEGLDSRHEIRFGCGIASFPDDGRELSDLIRLSDARMYLDKTLVKSMAKIEETASES
jgi:diguanylate cyclase (GGDEF)-like protein